VTAKVFLYAKSRREICHLTSESNIHLFFPTIYYYCWFLFVSFLSSCSISLPQGIIYFTTLYTLFWRVNQLVLRDALLYSIMHEWYSSSDKIASHLSMWWIYFFSFVLRRLQMIVEKKFFFLIHASVYVYINLLTFFYIKCQYNYRNCHWSSLNCVGIQTKKYVITRR
jgi:hypothetical protein